MRPVKVKMLVAQSCPNLCDPMDCVAHQAPLSMGFSRQEHWSGLPFPSSRDLPDLGIEPRSPALQADSSPSEPPGKFIGYQTSNMSKKGSESTLPQVLYSPQEGNICPPSLWRHGPVWLLVIQHRITHKAPTGQMSWFCFLICMGLSL